MSNLSDINVYILERVSEGGFDEEVAFRVLKELNSKNQAKVVEKDIAIIGMACRFSSTQSVEEYWGKIIAAKKCISKFPEGRKSDILNYMEAFQLENKELIKWNAKEGYLNDIDKFDAEFFRISPKEVTRIEPAQRIFLEVAYEAIEDSGYGGNRIKGSKTGVFVGRDHTTTESIYKNLIVDPDTLALTGSFSGILASRISYIFNFRGPSMVIDTACSSGLVAVHEACQALRNNECQLAIAGGVQIAYLPSTGGMASMVESDDGNIRTFDKNSKGTVWGEGVGAVMLKPLSKAIEDRDNIYAVIKGSAINNDGASSGITAPSAEAQTEVIVKAWQEAKVDPETIAYIEAHGTGTKLGDPIEIKGITNAFRRYTDKKQFCGIGTVKTNVGHLISASGLASLIKVVMSLKNKVIPANINFNEPNPLINFCDSPVYVNDRLKNWDTKNCPRRAGINAFGFSGTNCHMVLEEYTINQVENSSNKGYRILALSAKSIIALRKLVKRYHSFLCSNTEISLDDLCYTANTGRGHYNYRLAIISKSTDELRNKLDYLCQYGLAGTDSEGIYFGEYRIARMDQGNIEDIGLIEIQARKMSESVQTCISNLHKSDNEIKELLEELVQLYVKGADIDWNDLYKEQKRNKISLPAYPLERVRYWPKLKTSRGPDESYLYKNYWVQNEIVPAWKSSESNTLMIFKDVTGIGEGIASHFKSEGKTVIEVVYGNERKKINDFKFMIEGTQSDYDWLIKEVWDNYPKQIIHTASLMNDTQARCKDDMERFLKYGVYSLFFLLKALSERSGTENHEIILLSDYASNVTAQQEKVIPHNAALFGLGKVAEQEYLNMKVRCIDIDNKTTCNEIINEINSEKQGYITAYRNGIRYTEVLEELVVEDIRDKEIKINDEGIYIITGGMGGIGLNIAEYLASKNAGNIALINRTEFPERNEWDSILDKIDAQQNIIDGINRIRNIEKYYGTNILTLSADTANEVEIEQLFKTLKKKYNRINGIVHAAGVSQSNLISDKDFREFESAIRPKIFGTWVLDKVTAEENMDFFIMFSSVSAIIGAFGHGDYVAANSYIDIFEAYRNRQGRTSMVINWPAWKDTGMMKNVLFDEEKQVFQQLSKEDAIDIFEQLLKKDLTKVIAGRLNYKSKIIDLADILPVEFSSAIQSKISKYRNQLDKRSNRQQDINAIEFEKEKIVLKGRKDSDYSDIERKLTKIWANILGLKEIEIYENFYNMGGDSILIHNLRVEIEKEYGKIIDVSDIFSYPSVAKLALFISDKLASTKEGDASSMNEKKDIDEITSLIDNLKHGKLSVDEGLKMLNGWRSEENE